MLPISPPRRGRVGVRARIGVALFALAALVGIIAAPAAEAQTAWYLKHNASNENIVTTCHTSAAHSGVTMTYCLHIGVTNHGSSTGGSYTTFVYATTAWCNNATSGAEVKCTSVNVAFTVTASGNWYNGAYVANSSQTVKDYLICSTSCAAAGTHNSTGWAGGINMVELNAPNNGPTLCAPSPYYTSSSTSVTGNGYAVGTASTGAYQVCDKTASGW